MPETSAEMTWPKNRRGRRYYDTDEQHAGRPHRKGINWSAVAVIVALATWVIGGAQGWFGANAAEIRRINDRLAAVEVGMQTLREQRTEDRALDERQRQEIIKRLDYLNNKADEVLRWVK